jgi:hypothetical protein
MQGVKTHLPQTCESGRRKLKKPHTNLQKMSNRNASKSSNSKIIID